MSHDFLQPDIRSLLGLDDLSQTEQDAFLSQIGELIIESALLRLVADMSEEQEVSFNHFLETDPDPESLMQHLITHFKAFEKILDEEVQAFREETIAVLGKGAMREAGAQVG